MLAPPRISQSIRFRLSLTYALAVFTAGSMLIGGLYAWQVNQLDEPRLVTGLITLVDPETRAPIETVVVVGGESELKIGTIFEYNAYLFALDNLKRASLAGLGILFVISFITGWLLAGWALRPVHRMTMVARDITATDLSRRIALPGPADEMKSLADTFDAMLDRLQGAFEDQRRFVQDASHELRNPLAVARTNLELALSDPNATPEDIRKSADVAMRSTERMSSLVDDLLVQARSGVPEIQRTDVDLVATAGDVVEEFTAQAAKQGLVVQLVSPMAPLYIKGDGPALQRAISNLVANAIKASPQGRTVRVSVAQGGHSAVVSVQDEGVGIREADKKNLFKRFWRGSRDDAGTGLGLSIVKQIVERHGGTVTVESTVDVGSTFTVKVPIGEQPQEGRSAISGQANPAAWP